MQIEGSLCVALLAELTFEVGCMLANHFEVIVLEAFTDLEVGKKALLPDFLI